MVVKGGAHEDHNADPARAGTAGRRGGQATGTRPQAAIRSTLLVLGGPGEEALTALKAA